MPLDVSSADALYASIKGRSDDEVLADAAAQGGVEAVADAMFEEMRAGFVADGQAQQRTIIGHRIGTPDGDLAYSLIIENGECTLVKNLDEPARLTIVVSFLDYLRLGSKELNAMLAFGTRRFKIEGDMAFATTMAKWFPESG